MGVIDLDKRDKVIKGLECCLLPHDPDCDLCPYDSIDLRCRAQLRDDVMALLETQEPVEPTLDIRHGKSMWRCGSCSTALQPNQMHAKFCFNCGRAVKWK